MASFLKNFLANNQKPAQAPLDDGFADFASAPEPQPQAQQAPPSLLGSLGNAFAPQAAAPSLGPTVPFTAWYRVWERTSPSDFIQEAIIFPFIVAILALHIWGLGKNKRKAREWAKHHVPAIAFEYAQVGFDGPTNIQTEADIEATLQQNTAAEYVTYATGRQNVAFTDFKITLAKRYNPLVQLGENLIGLIFEAVQPTVEQVEATAYVFDNKEADFVPRKKTDPPVKGGNSSYDGFVWAVVNKRQLKRLRDDRYDLSLTTVKDHAKLPPWITVMTESAEITETILTPELIKTIEDAGDLFESLIITDQPLDQPTKLQDTIPKKRLSLIIRIPSDPSGYISTIPLFASFLRLPDFLVQNGKFRPEAIRKVKQTRDTEINRIKKRDDDEKAEERKLQADKDKKEKREETLKNMSAKEQQKFLDKEREKETRKSQKKRTMRA